ncbi:hypothetical protein AVEN_21779-1 [Araneus ventricosus]|uniref:RNase H type-1 domain-containing protein n=1 Tax=Araneus ventricosus TaxID=182803 RepID=A0A4Y2NQG5_ARAVE|nr:hypothetical protein AVEN_21779-1 [Araneus ventricosus]
MDNLILEISQIGLNGSLDLLVGDFNARSPIWGYGLEDRRGQIMSEFIASNNFSICNRTDLGPTFVCERAQGFPDLSLLSIAFQGLFDSWWILNKDSLSDHRYICVQLAGDFHCSDDFVFKTKHSPKRFLRIFKQNFGKLNMLSNSVSSVEDIDRFYNAFNQTVCDAAFSTFKKKPIHNKNFFKFWNSELRVKRNRVTALYRNFTRIKNSGAPEEAYADDLALVVSASSRKVLEESVSSFLDVLKNFLKELNLQIASEKTLAVVFRGNQNKNRQKRGLASLKRSPIFKIGGRTIRTVDSLKYLDPNWGTGVSLLKHWYLSVIQPSLLYGAAVWGGSFTQKQINTLHSIQRVALVKISKSFRTCPTNALNVFLGLPPLHVVANSLFIKFKIWNARCDDYNFMNTNNLDFYIKVNNLDLNLRLIEFPTYIPDAYFDVYTDGSGIDGNIGASVCIFKNNILVNSFKFKLNNYNSVFQAELAAINFAAGWALDNNYKINIFTDSYSSIEVLKKVNSKSNYINLIKINMFRAIGSVGLSWVKALAGIPGNELADQLAKEATIDGNLLSLLAPYSYLKKFIHSYVIDKWRHWGYSNSGVRVREFVPIVDSALLTHNRALLFFISGHGPFPAYLFRFKFFNSPNCICGGLGDPDHYAFDCSQTSDFHFTRPAVCNKPAWFKSILNNSNALFRMERICSIARKICDDLKSRTN